MVKRLKEASKFVKAKKQKMVRWAELKKARKKNLIVINPTEQTLLAKDGQKTEEEEQLRKELFTNQYKTPYLEVPREPGSGPVRIGSKLAIGQDIYSLLFVSFFNWELVKKAQSQMEEEEELQEDMLKKFVKERELKKSQTEKKSLTRLEMKEMLKERFEKFQDNYFDKLDGLDEFGESEMEKPDERKVRI
jgi:hypothetical protein